MLTKTLRNAVAATAVAGTALLPAATTIAPQVENMACKYPNSIATGTDASAYPPAVHPGEPVQITVRVTAGDVTPKGTVHLAVTGPKGKRVRDKEKELSNQGTVVFTVGGFKLGKHKDGKTYKAVAHFNGGCRFKNSRGIAYFSVMR